MTRDPGEIGQKIDPPWDDLTHERVFSRIEELQRSAPVAAQTRKEHKRFVIPTLVTAAAAAALTFWFVRGEPLEPSPVVPITSPVASAPVGADPIRFAEGVTGTPTRDAEVSIVEQSADRVAVSQTKGSVKYSVDPAQKLSFEVVVQGVQVKVLGTVFEVAALERGAEVAVERGEVQVTHLDGVSILSAGQRDAFYGAPQPADEDEAEQPAPATTKPVRQTTGGKRLSARELLQRAATARAEGDDKGSAALLREYLRAYPNDPRAVPARFTLGRIETTRGRHLVAAAQFQRVQQQAADGPLAEDALAEEAWNRHRGGQAARAKELAEKYLERYPAGPHRARMKTVTGDE